MSNPNQAPRPTSDTTEADVDSQNTALYAKHESAVNALEEFEGEHPDIAKMSKRRDKLGKKIEDKGGFSHDFYMNNEYTSHDPYKLGRSVVRRLVSSEARLLANKDEYMQITGTVDTWNYKKHQVDSNLEEARQFKEANLGELIDIAKADAEQSGVEIDTGDKDK